MLVFVGQGRALYGAWDFTRSYEAEDDNEALIKACSSEKQPSRTKATPAYRRTSPRQISVQTSSTSLSVPNKSVLTSIFEVLNPLCCCAFCSLTSVFKTILFASVIGSHQPNLHTNQEDAFIIHTRLWRTSPLFPLSTGKVSSRPSEQFCTFASSTYC